VSIARATFASNSANTEGWALYAETIMTPHFPADGQLFAL
jgi:predicted outer membrane repeat protein